MTYTGNRARGRPRCVAVRTHLAQPDAHERRYSTSCVRATAASSFKLRLSCDRLALAPGGEAVELDALDRPRGLERRQVGAERPRQLQLHLPESAEPRRAGAEERRQ